MLERGSCFSGNRGWTVRNGVSTVQLAIAVVCSSDCTSRNFRILQAETITHSLRPIWIDLSNIFQNTSQDGHCVDSHESCWTRLVYRKPRVVYQSERIHGSRPSTSRSDRRGLVFHFRHHNGVVGTRNGCSEPHHASVQCVVRPNTSHHGRGRLNFSRRNSFSLSCRCDSVCSV